MRSYIELNINNVVYEKNESTTLYGSVNEENNKAQYDRSLLVSKNPIYDLAYTSKVVYGLFDGFIQSDLANSLSNENQTFLLEKDGAISVDKNSFFFKDKEYQLYSDNSFAQTMSLDSLWQATLNEKALLDTLSVGYYKRDKENYIYCYEQYSYIETFSVLDSEAFSFEEMNTEVLNQRLMEYTIYNSTVYLNQNKTKQLGFDKDVDFVEIFPEAGSSVVLEYCNVYDVQVYYKNDDEYLNSYNNFLSIDENSFGFVVDKSLGIVSFTGGEDLQAFLKEGINNVATSISLIVDDFDQWPDQGIVKINDEYILYLEKSSSSLERCIRGSNASLPLSHSSNSIVTMIRGSFKSGQYFVSYKVAPQIEYEVTDCQLRKANAFEWLNVSPMNNVQANKILQLSTETKNIANIVLEIDRNYIGSDLYGPIYFGNDVSRLKATAYSYAGNPVDDIEITLEKVIGPGGLEDGNASIIVRQTNSEGEIYGHYYAPYEESAILFKVNSIDYDDTGTMVVLDELPYGILANEISLYQILKHDPCTGTVGKRIESFAGGSAIEPYGSGYFDIYMQYNEDYNNGVMQVLYDNIKYTFKISKVYLMHPPNEPRWVRVYVNNHYSWMDSIIEPVDCWLYQEKSLVWDSASLNGVHVLLYEWSERYTHPITNIVGAYGPVLPDRISEKTLYFDDKYLPSPDPDDDRINLGGYAIVAPSEVKFKAYAKDPMTGRIINSNEIRAKVILPSSLKGVSEGALPIPHGFQLVSESFNEGAGLGGSNFLTINKNSVNTNSINIFGEI